jgi:INO80 complex subunit C
LSYYDIPRPFRNPNFVSRLGERTATASTSGVKKNVKQLLILERERISGGDGFLSAAQTAAKARGEPIEVGKKKKNPAGMNRPKGWNLKGRKSGVATPMTVESGGSGTGTPAREEEDDEEEADAEEVVAPGIEANGSAELRQEIITCKWTVLRYFLEVMRSLGRCPCAGLSERTDHTPAAPPSLLPAKKYCDITGLHAAYTDPRTKLRYKGLEVWHVVRGLVSFLSILVLLA